MNERHTGDDGDFAERFRREYQKTPLPGPEALEWLDRHSRRNAAPDRWFTAAQ